MPCHSLVPVAVDWVAVYLFIHFFIFSIQSYKHRSVWPMSSFKLRPIICGGIVHINTCCCWMNSSVYLYPNSVHEWFTAVTLVGPKVYNQPRATSGCGYHFVGCRQLFISHSIFAVLNESYNAYMKDRYADNAYMMEKYMWNDTAYIYIYIYI